MPEREQAAPTSAGHKDAKIASQTRPAAPGQDLAGAAGIWYLQKAAGNGAVGALLARMDSDRPVPTLPRHGNGAWPAAALPAVQRQVGAAAQATSGVSLTMGPMTVSTFDGLLSAAHFMNDQLTTAAADVPVGETQRTAADDLVKQEQAWEPFLQGKGTDPLDQPAVDQATLWYQAYVQALKDLETYKKAKARADLQTSADDADQARQAIDGIPDQMADYQRGAFLNKNDDILEKITKVLGMSLQASTALIEIHEKCMEMVGWLVDETTHVDELVEKFGPFAEIGHKVVAAYEGLSAALTLLRGGEGATEVEQETSKASAGLGLAGAAGSLTGFASAYMLYFGALLTVGQAALKVVGVIIRENAHLYNTLALATGNPDEVDWSAEPGGREAYDFMVAVMHAGSSVDIPSPIPGEVDKLIIESEDEFEKGTGQEVPTKGWWFWKKTDPNKIKYWLIRNRQSVWNMLYGSVTPP